MSVENAITELAITQGMLWVGSEEGRSITTHDLDTGAQVGEPFEPGEGFEGVFAVGEDAVWAVGADGHDGSNLIRIDIQSRVPEFVLHTEAPSFLIGVAYGEGMVWIADAAGKRNLVTAFDSRSRKPVAEFKIKASITGDDIAVIPGGVLVWEPENGRLTPIHLDGPREPRGEKVRGYPEGQKSNIPLSDLAVDGDFAWVTDPANDTVYKEEY